jgi:hypothetical protein
MMWKAAREEIGWLFKSDVFWLILGSYFCGICVGFLHLYKDSFLLWAGFFLNLIASLIRMFRVTKDVKVGQFTRAMAEYQQNEKKE